MTGNFRHAIFDTDMGWMGVLGSAAGLRRVTLPQRSAKDVRRILSINDAFDSPYLFEEFIRRFRAYFSGYQVTFPDRLDLAGATDFQQRVWATTRLIPYGTTRSYRWVAQEINQPNAVRAVGQALGRNPLPIIVPCHRVVAGDGRLGGFTGGIEMKINLLKLEGSRI